MNIFLCFLSRFNLPLKSFELENQPRHVIQILQGYIFMPASHANPSERLLKKPGSVEFKWIGVKNVKRVPLKTDRIMIRDDRGESPSAMFM